MSISDKLKLRNQKTIISYVMTSVFCVIFHLIYARFSHGVSSAYMTYMFLYPLLGGVLVFLAGRMLHLPAMTRMAYNAYNAGIVTLLIGSLLRGIFVIAGTGSTLTNVFYVCGIVLLVVALVQYARQVLARSYVNI